MSEKVSASPSRLLVVGCGNPAAGDDGAGVEIVRRLSELGDCGCRPASRNRAGRWAVGCLFTR